MMVVLTLIIIKVLIIVMYPMITTINNNMLIMCKQHLKMILMIYGIIKKLKMLINILVFKK